MFVGFDKTRKGYLIWDNVKRKIIHSKDVRFVPQSHHCPETNPETDTTQTSNGATVTRDAGEAQDQEHRDVTVDGDDEPSASTQTLIVSDGADGDEITLHIDEAEVERVNGTDELIRQRRSERINARNIGEAHLVMMEQISEPATYEEARASPHWEQWAKAMVTEIRALLTNGTWKWEPRDGAKRPVKCKWVFKIKLDADGNIEKYKARLVACGYSQVQDIDFFETKAYVSTKTPLRFTVAASEKFNLETEVFDVPSAYVKAPLDVTVDIELSRGFQGESDGILDLLGEFGLERGQQWVARLVKGLYGLRQSGRTWFQEIDAKLKSMRLVSTKADRCLYYARGENGELLLLLLYVDDILIAHNWPTKRDEIVKELVAAYDIKTLGSLRHFLGMSFRRVPGKGTRLNDIQGTFIGQERYADELLRRFGVDGDPGTWLPMTPTTQLQ